MLWLPRESAHPALPRPALPWRWPRAVPAVPRWRLPCRALAVCGSWAGRGAMNARLREPLPDVEDWAARLGLRHRSGEYAGPCPVCGGTDRFHVGRGRGGAARVGCRGCIDGRPAKERGEAFGRILRAAFPERDGAEGRDMASHPPRTGEPPRRSPERDSGPASGLDDADDAGRKAAWRVWEQARPLAGTLAEIYLHARSVGHVAGASSLRFAAALSHRYAPGRFPCLVARVQDAHGGFLGVQRTYLAADGAGKANVEPERTSRGSLSGGAVRLAVPEHGRLLLGEGIETTVSAMLLFARAGWATLGAPGLRAIELPEHVREVVIAADRDAEGLQAAAALARRLEAEGRAVEIRRPHKGDFNDVLRESRQ